MTEGEDTTEVLMPSWKTMNVERFLLCTNKIEMASMYYKQGKKHCNSDMGTTAQYCVSLNNPILNLKEFHCSPYITESKHSEVDVMEVKNKFKYPHLILL